jgi:hypothetical protein
LLGEEILVRRACALGSEVGNLMGDEILDIATVQRDPLDRDTPRGLVLALREGGGNRWQGGVCQPWRLFRVIPAIALEHHRCEDLSSRPRARRHPVTPVIG